MTRCLFTNTFLESLKYAPPPSKYIHYRDEELSGFILEYRRTRKGTWYFRYRDGHMKMRLWRLGALATMSLAEARVDAHAVKQLIDKGGDPHRDWALRADALTLEEFVTEQYIPHAKAKKRSWDFDQRILRCHILPILGARHIHQIRYKDVAAWQKGMKKSGLATGTCNRALVVLKTVFNAAVHRGLLSAEKNPCTRATLLADTPVRERYLTVEEARNLIHALETSHEKLSAQAILLLLFTGARKNEILAARWEYVDMERRLLTVPLSKSGKTRHIPLSDAALRILDAIPRQDGSGWIFFNPVTGSHLQTVFTLWKSIRASLGLHDVRLLDLRHSFAKFLLTSGRSLCEVQACLGHETIRMTMRYAHFAPTSLLNAVNSVETALSQHE